MTAKKVLIVSDNPAYKELFDQPEFAGYNCIGVAATKEDALSRIYSEPIDILIVCDGVPSSRGTSTEEFILSQKKSFSETRIIYLAGAVSNSDVQRLRMMGEFVSNGVYDFFTEPSIDAEKLLELLEHPRTKEDVAEYLIYYQPGENVSQSISNVIVCSSVKPGTGKSTLAINLAVGIAKYGQKKTNGKAPRVAIIEGDLSSLSVGTLLKVENSQYNLKRALNLVRTVVDQDGVITGTDEQLKEVKKGVRSCFVKYSGLDNLYAMVSSDMSLNDVMRVSPSQYYFMIQCVTGAFDVVIVDANSSLEHRTTGPLLEMASRCYFVLDLDFNDIQNNLRYMRELQELGISGKIHYVLNKNIEGEDFAKHLEDLKYQIDDFEKLNLVIDKTIPLIDAGIMMNHEYSGVPIVLDDDPKLVPYKKAFLEIANENWKIDFKEDEESKKKKPKPKPKPEPVKKETEKPGFFKRILGFLNK